jgi:hypothetical protein
MASPQCARAARYRHSGDPRIADELSRRVSCDPNSELPRRLRAGFLARRFGLATVLAAIVAAHAFGDGDR